jgi:ABC-type phosphate/phosphonate transport system substrate-binding protein
MGDVMAIANLARVHLIAVVGVLTCALNATCQPAKSLHIAMAKSFFADRGDTIKGIAADDFKSLLKATTGFDGELTTKLDPAQIADQLEKKQIDFGIFHAHELAWVQKNHPDLVPLLVAVNKKNAEQAHLIVQKNDPAKTFADLSGKKLDMPNGISELARIFVAKECQDAAKKKPADFFGSIGKSNGAVAAMDNVARGKAQATVVTGEWLEFYKEVKGPTFTNKLRVLEKSEVFPPSVIVYKRGALDQKTIDQFKSGLLKADRTELGSEMMKEWNIDVFQTPPNDYATRVTQLLKNYPAPDSKK